jgi:hypothetical protein
MRYQRKDLATGSNIGGLAFLPPELQGLRLDLLADLSWLDPQLGYKGQGFFPVEQRLEDAKEVKAAQIELAFTTRFANGFPCVIGGNTETLQMRPADQVNWLIFKDACDDNIAAGDGSAQNPLPLRTASNNEYSLTNVQGRNLMVALRTYGAGLLRRHWLLKDANKNATTEQEVQAIDVSAGWPPGGYVV